MIWFCLARLSPKGHSGEDKHIRKRRKLFQLFDLVYPYGYQAVLYFTFPLFRQNMQLQSNSSGNFEAHDMT